MKNNISILIPTYNQICLELVKSLQAQAMSLPSLDYEILVADDGSTNLSTVEANKGINALPQCRYIIRSHNAGRAAIRNFLAQQAQYDWLLFIDSDMTVRKSNYLYLYLTYINDLQLDKEHLRKAPQGIDILYGGYTIAYAQSDTLRYLFESKSPQNADYRLRLAHPFQDFHTSNFLVRRDIMLRYPLDKRFKQYGYEDVLWGKNLKEKGILIQHVDNPLSMESFETNRVFIEKTEESLRTLYRFQKDLAGYSKLLKTANRLKKLIFVYPLIKGTYPLISLHLKARLTYQKPKIFWFNIYKLIYFIHLAA